MHRSEESPFDHFVGADRRSVIAPPLREGNANALLSVMSMDSTRKGCAPVTGG